MGACLHDQSLGLHQGTFCALHCQCLIDGSDKPDIMTPLKCLGDLGERNKKKLIEIGSFGFGCLFPLLALFSPQRKEMVIKEHIH